MDVRGLLTEGFGRITELYDGVAEGLDERTLHERPDGTGNPVGWLLWHLARVQDHHVADLADPPQVWENFQERFGLANDTDDIGYGHTSEQVDAVRIQDPQLLVDYHHEVTLATARYLAHRRRGGARARGRPGLGPARHGRPRLVSIQGDCLQHLGQAAYVRVCSSVPPMADLEAALRPYVDFRAIPGLVALVAMGRRRRGDHARHAGDERSPDGARRDRPRRLDRQAADRQRSRSSSSRTGCSTSTSRSARCCPSSQSRACADADSPAR